LSNLFQDPASIRLDYNYQPEFPEPGFDLLEADITLENLIQHLADILKIQPADILICRGDAEPLPDHPFSILNPQGEPRDLPDSLPRGSCIESRWFLRGSAYVHKMEERAAIVCFDSLDIAGFPGVKLLLGPSDQLPRLKEPESMLLPPLYRALQKPPANWEELTLVRDYFISMMECEFPAAMIQLPYSSLENCFALKFPGISASQLYERLKLRGIFTHPPSSEEWLTFSISPGFSTEMTDHALAVLLPLFRQLVTRDLQPEAPPLPDKIMLCETCSGCKKNTGCHQSGSCRGCSEHSDKESL